jgi:type III secretion protein J
VKPWLWIPLVCSLLAGCREPNLLEGLNQLQANEVVAVLQRNNIAAHKQDTGKQGYAVRIGNAAFAAAVDLLHTYSLPSNPRMEVAQMFPADALVASPRAEKARLYSALEQRLEQSLGLLEGIAGARVHVSYDLDAGEGGRKPAPVHLSALAVYEQDIDPQLLITDIKRFLRNGFAGVEYENISVVLSRRAPVQHAPASVPAAATTLPVVWVLLVSLAVLLGSGFGGWRYLRGRREEGAHVP